MRWSKSWLPDAVPIVGSTVHGRSSRTACGWPDRTTSCCNRAGGTNKICSSLGSSSKAAQSALFERDDPSFAIVMDRAGPGSPAGIKMRGHRLDGVSGRS